MAERSVEDLLADLLGEGEVRTPRTNDQSYPPAWLYHLTPDS